MKLRIYSDMHLDHYAGNTRGENGRPIFWMPELLPDDAEATLLLVGDLWIGTRFIEYAGWSWIGDVAKQFKQVLIVLGNHDYWPQGKLTILNGGDRCNALLQDMGLHNVLVLDRSTFESEGVLFVGATLWTDMNRGDPLTMYNMRQVMAYDGKCRYETGEGGYMSSFTSYNWINTHAAHKAYIRKVLAENPNKKTVVMTHHLPLLTLGDPQYAGDAANAYYMSDLSDVVLDNPQVVLWAYGHTHFQSDTKLGSTRFINNCVGYQGEHMEQEGRVRHEYFEV